MWIYPIVLKNLDLINEYFVNSVRQIPNTIDIDALEKYPNIKCTSSDI